MAKKQAPKKTTWDDILKTSVSGSATKLERESIWFVRKFQGNSIYATQFHREMLKRRFLIYKANWNKEIGFTSNISEIVSNRYYNLIIELGIDVVPIIIEDLKQQPNHWFYALEDITGINAINPNHYGDLKLMSQDWINWANQNDFA